MKKRIFRMICSILAVALAFALCTALLPTQASASTAYTVRLAAEDGNSVITAMPGDTVTLMLKLENNPGVIGVGVQLQYPSVLSLTEKPGDISGFREVGSGYFITSETLTANPYLLWWNYALGDEDRKLITAEGNMAQIRFTVDQDAAPGDYPITLTTPADKNTTAETDGSGEILPNTNTPITLATVGCTIRVTDACIHSFGEWTDVPGDAPSCTEGGTQSRTCARCGEPETRQVGAKGHSYVDGSCSVCGDPQVIIPGDINEDGLVTRADVIHLLLHVTLSDRYPINAEADFNGDNTVTRADVIRLLLHVTLPDRYPLETSN